MEKRNVMEGGRTPQATEKMAAVAEPVVGRTFTEFDKKEIGHAAKSTGNGKEGVPAGVR